MDRGVAGIDATLAEFDRVGISQSGAARSPAEARPEAAIYDVDGVAVAHLSYSWYIGGQSVPCVATVAGEHTHDLAGDRRRPRCSCSGRPGGGHELHVGRRPGRVADGIPAIGRAGRHRIGRGRPDRRAAGARAPADREGQRCLGDLRDGQLPQRSPGRFVPTGGGDAAIFVVGVVVRPDGSILVQPPVAYPTWIDKSNGHVIRPVGQRLDPTLDAATRAALQRSLDRTRSVLGPYVFERA